MIYHFEQYYKTATCASAALMLQIPIWLVDLTEWLKFLSVIASLIAGGISIYNGMKLKKK